MTSQASAQRATIPFELGAVFVEPDVPVNRTPVGPIFDIAATEH